MPLHVTQDPVLVDMLRELRDQAIAMTSHSSHVQALEWLLTTSRNQLSNELKRRARRDRVARSRRLRLVRECEASLGEGFCPGSTAPALSLARRQEIREALTAHQDELLSMTRADQLRAARDHAHETFIRDETCWRGFFN